MIRLQRGQRALVMCLCIAAIIIVSVAVFIEFWPFIVGYIQKTQSGLHRDLAAAMRAVYDDPEMASGTLIVLSFLYGVFHAAGPGHGKLIIATYMASHPTQLLHGLVISAASSLFQGVTAIVAVGSSLWFLDKTARDITVLSGNMELISYGLIIILGAYLSFAAARKLHKAWRARHGSATRSENTHVHHHSHCGHTHAPLAVAGWRANTAMVASIGIRPCSGAILVLVLAFALGIAQSGVIAVLAMSIGTAITVSALAILSIVARSWAQRLATSMPSSSGYLSFSGSVASFIGGVLIVILGASLINATLVTANHPLM